MSEEQNKFEKRKQEAQKRKRKLQKMQNSKIKPRTKHVLAVVGGALAAIIVVIALVFANAGFTRRMVTALEIGNEKVSSAEYSYYYIQQAISTYNTYVQMLGSSYAPFDTGKSLDRQAYSDTQSWADYLSDSAISALRGIKTLVQAANEEGFTISEEGVETVERTMQSLQTYADSANMTLNRYLADVYGLGMDENLMRQTQMDYQLALEYEEALKARPEYTDEDLEDYYQNSVYDTYTYVDLRYYEFAQEEATDDSEGKTLEEAKAEADDFISDIDSAADYSRKIRALLREEALENTDSEDSSSEEEDFTDNTERIGVSRASLENVDANLAEWAFAEERAVDDVAVVENEDGTGYYAVYMVNTAYRNDYNTVNMRQIYIEVEDTEDEEAMEEAKTRAEEILQEWKDGEATEESFAALADEESDLSVEGGLYEQMAKGEGDITDWLFDENRQPGDTAVLESSGGYHVVYYIGQDEPYWKVQVESAKRSEDYNNTYAELEEKYPVVEHAFGIWLRSEPFR